MYEDIKRRSSDVWRCAISGSKQLLMVFSYGPYVHMLDQPSQSVLVTLPRVLITLLISTHEPPSILTWHVPPSTADC